MDIDFQNLPERAILVHGGQHKTGSSVIQNALAGQRERLAELGWCYPQTSQLGQDASGQRHVDLMAELRKGDACPSWEQLRQDIAHWPGRVLLSHENFFSPHIDPRALRAQLPADRPVFLLAYLRHPADYIESCYREWVRRGKFSGSMREHYRQRRGYLDVAALSDAWEAAIGPGHVLLRPYDRGQFEGGSVLTDFLARLDLDPALADISGHPSNSLNSAQVMFHLVANQLRLSPAKRDALADLLGDAENTALDLASWPKASAADSSPKALLVAALQYVLDHAETSHRLMDDGLLAEIEQHHLGSFRDAVIRHGASPDSLRSASYAGLPHAAELFAPELRSAIEQLLA